MGADEQIEDILNYMELAKERFRQPTDAAFRRQVPLSYFAGAEPITDDHVALHGEDTGNLYQFFRDAKPGDLSGPIDITLLSTVVEDDLGQPARDYKFALSRYRQVSLKEVRGRAAMVYPQMIEWAAALVAADGSYGNEVAYAGWDGSQWRAVPRKHPVAWGTVVRPAPGRALGDPVRQPGIAVSVQFTRRYTWRVFLGYSDSHTISFPTDPIGAREVFRLRDIPEGRSRRTALRHWVNEHWRKSRSDSTVETLIRKHLRGAAVFDWNGLHCRILPAEFDVEQLEELKGLSPERRARAARVSGRTSASQK